MIVTIIGAGNMGRGIATRAIAGGHEVEIIDRDPAEARKLAEELGGSATALEADAAFGGEIVSLPSTTRASKKPSTSTATGSPARSSSTSPIRSIRRRGIASLRTPAAPPPR